MTAVMPMIGARFYAHAEAQQMRVDLLENELAKEAENARLFALIAKINCMLDRHPEYICLTVIAELE